MFLFVGLGNPGDKYQNTRHNIGFAAVERFSDIESNFKTNFQAKCLKTTLEGKAAVVLQPQTYMNLSGSSVQKAMQFYKIPPENVYVFVDDVNIELGTIRIRTKGSHGGQNGLKDIIQRIGPNFNRIRLGVGKCPPGYDLSNFVLGKFTKTEINICNSMLDKMPLIVESILTEGVTNAMNKFNGGPSK